MAEVEKSDYDAVNDFCKTIGDVQGMLLRIIREKEALERENKDLNKQIKEFTDKLRAAKKQETAGKAESSDTKELELENKKLKERVAELSKQTESARSESESIRKNISNIEALIKENEAIRNAIREVQERNVFLAGKYKELEQSLAKYEYEEEEE